MKIGDKDYSDEELQAIVTEHGSLKTQLEEANPVLAVAKEYGVTPEQFVNEAKGSFGALLKLQELGVLDKDGKVVQQKQAPVDPNPNPKPSPSPSPSPSPALSVEDIAKQALEQVTPTIKALQEENKKLRDSMNLFHREKIVGLAKEKNLDVSDEDISIALAQANRSGEDFWKILDGRSTRNADVKKSAIESFAKEHNLDIEQLNKVKEISSTEGKAAQVVTEGRQLTLRPKPGDDTQMTPLQATQQLFKLKGQG